MTSNFLALFNILSNYTTDYITLESSIWSKMMFIEIATESLVECMARCSFDFGSQCKALVFLQPLCYLGDPFINNGSVGMGAAPYFYYRKYGT